MKSKISHRSLFGGPSNMSYQLSISDCCCASLYGKVYIKMLEASNDPILEFSEPGGYTFSFKERERERQRETERDRERQRETERDRERQRETERDRERQRETERDRERQRETERDRERRRETERDRERQRERERERERERFGPYWRRVHAPSTPNANVFWTICGKAAWTRAVLKQNLSIKSTN